MFRPDAMLHSEASVPWLDPVSDTGIQIIDILK